MASLVVLKDATRELREEWMEGNLKIFKDIYKLKKLNLWLTAPRGATPVN